MTADGQNASPSASEGTAVLHPPPPRAIHGGYQELGTIVIAVFLYAVLIDAASETFIHDSPGRRLVIGVSLAQKREVRGAGA